MLLFTLFCRKIFATIYALSYGAKLSPKVYLWRKNDKYEVYPDVVSRVVSNALTAGYRMIDTADLYENHRQIATALNVSLPSLGLERKVYDSVFF